MKKDFSKSGRVLAFDPGTTTGWSLFDDGVLVSGGKMTKKKIMAGDVPDFGKIDLLLIEMPKIYPAGRQKKPPNDIIQTAILAGHLSGLYRKTSLLVEFVLPEDWKGSIPKEIHQLRIWRALSTEEKSRLLKDHNTVDAAGIGLWRIRRLRR